MFGLIIVEDDPMLRNSLSQGFPWEKYGFRLLGCAQDGMAALHLIKELAPDAVMTDIRMPKMDGLTLMGAIRREGFSPEVVLLSAYDDFQYAQRGLNAGAFAYILKIDVFEEMEPTMLRLAEHLQKKKSASQEQGENEEELQLRNSATAIQYALQYIPAHLNEGIRVSELAERFKLSANYFSQRFHQETGTTYVNYVKMLRLKRAKEMLVKTDNSLQKIARETGLQNAQYFCKFFKAETKMTPSQYRKQYRTDGN